MDQFVILVHFVKTWLDPITWRKNSLLGLRNVDEKKPSKRIQEGMLMKLIQFLWQLKLKLNNTKSNTAKRFVGLWFSLCFLDSMGARASRGGRKWMPLMDGYIDTGATIFGYMCFSFFIRSKCNSILHHKTTPILFDLNYFLVLLFTSMVSLAIGL